MNNQPPSDLQDRIANSAPNKPSWMQWIDRLPIRRKIEQISWINFGGLVLVVGAGGAFLYGSLKAHLFEQSRSRLNFQSEAVEALIARDTISDGSSLERTLATVAEAEYSAVYLRQPNGELLLTSSSNGLALTDSQIIDLAIKSNGEIVARPVAIEGQKYALTAKTISNSTGEPIGVLVHGNSLDILTTTLRNTLLAQSLLVVVVLVIVVYFNKAIGEAIVEPIESLEKTARDFTEGNLQARAQIDTIDELGLLSSTFNTLFDFIAGKETRFKHSTERSRLLQEIVVELSRAKDVTQILQIAVESSKEVLHADRVVYHRFGENWSGEILAEAVEEQLPKMIGVKFEDPYLVEGYVEQYLQGQVKAIANIEQAELDEWDLKMLEPFGVVASIITPVIVEDRLAGLLVAHQCSGARTWEDEEIELLKQIAFQVGRLVEKSELLAKQQQAQEQERTARENLQRRALELLMEVDPVSQGDLTVQVKVQEDEIGTIGDSYNATIESLRALVSQVKTAALQVSRATSDKDRSIRELSTEASAQTTEIDAALTRIQEITDSIQAVADNAKAAEAAMLKAAQTVSAGDDAMNQTVVGFQEIRDTVAATAKKVKRLGESSQKISKVVNLIGNFADQTNLLALNASIEAAHAGEEGRGFAVVADEVRSLARQSASATAEIEALVAEIQAETNEVVAAMEAGTEQVVAGTKLVDKTRFSLIQIADVSQEINRLVEEIAAATVKQSKDSEVVSQTMVQVAAISQKTAAEAGEVSASFQDLLNVAQQLQESVARFKVS